MDADIRSHINNCSVCKQVKPANRSQQPEPAKQRIVTKPFQIIAADFIQALPRPKSGNIHLFVVMDLFSKWCLLTPVRKISSTSIVKLLEEQWFRRLSVPECIITDNATSFLSKDFKGLLEKYHIKHWANARHHSQANPTERLNRTINMCMRTYVKQNQRLWDTRVSEIEFCLNNTPHTSTSYSPYRVIFGHEIISDAQEHLMDLDTEDIGNEERLVTKGKIDAQLYSNVIKNLAKAHLKSISAYNLRSQQFAPAFAVGQRVFKRNFRQSSIPKEYNAKLDSLYTPCIVLARVGTSSYDLADEHGKRLGIFSVTDLKPGD